HYGEPVCFAQVECGNGLEEKLLGRSRGKRYNLVMTMGAPPGLHHITLSAERREARRRTCTLNVYHHTWSLHCYPEPDVFHHQTEPRAGGRCHAFCSGAGSAENCGHCGYLIFHLDKDPANFGKPSCHVLGYFGGRCDRIAGKEAAAGGKRALRACRVTVHEMLSGKNCRFHKKKKPIKVIGLTARKPFGPELRASRSQNRDR